MIHVKNFALLLCYFYIILPAWNFTHLIVGEFSGWINVTPEFSVVKSALHQVKLKNSYALIIFTVSAFVCACACLCMHICVCVFSLLSELPHTSNFIGKTCLPAFLEMKCFILTASNMEHWSGLNLIYVMVLTLFLLPHLQTPARTRGSRHWSRSNRRRESCIDGWASSFEAEKRWVREPFGSTTRFT